MSNKKRNIVLAAASLLVLTSCGSEIKGLPNDYNDKLVGETDVYNNAMQVVVDLIRDSSSFNGDVHEELMKIVALDKYGEEASWKDDFKALVASRINEKLLSKVKSSSYAVDGLFSEKKFAQSLVKNMQLAVSDYDAVTEWHEDVIFTPDINKDNLGEKVLHLDYYKEYISKELQPTVLQELLIEDYVMSEDARSLYLSKGRKVEYIAISTNEKHPEAAKYLIDTFIDTNIVGEDATKESANLEILANAWRGVEDQFVSNEKALLEAADVIGDDFNNTIWGDVLSRYALIKDDKTLTDSSAESEFTNSYAYTKEHGLELKTNSTKAIDYTVDGWFIKDGGLTNLPTAIRDRLFDRNTENGVDSVLDDKGDRSKAGFLDESGNSFNTYIRNINGVYYLTKGAVEETNPRDILHYDSSSSTYYIIQVHEAVSRNKFTEDNKDYYGEEKLALVSREIAKNIATKDTIKTRATEFYIEAADIKFSDQQVYDYFVELYPDIFDK